MLQVSLKMETLHQEDIPSQEVRKDSQMECWYKEFQGLETDRVSKNN